MNLTTKQLRIFLTIVQTGTIAATAEKIFLTKPAISIALSELEKQLGHPLFDRYKNRLILNAEGKRLLPLADEFLARSETIAGLFNPTAEMSGKLRIGSSHTVGNYITPLVIKDFRLSHHHHHQSLYIANTTQIGEMLSRFELDVALVEGTIKEAQVIANPWMQDEMVIVCPPDHALAKSTKKVKFSDLNNQEWILRETGSGTREFFHIHLAPHLKQWQLGFELSSTTAILNSVIAKLGITCISRVAAQEAINNKLLKVVNISLPTRQYWLAYLKEKYQSPLLKTFINFCVMWPKTASTIKHKHR